MVMMINFTNNSNTWIWVVLLVLAVCAAIYFILNKMSVEEEVIIDEESNAALQHIAEYRTYMVNQWICLLGFWFNIEVKPTQTKLTTPGLNQNGVYFFYENLEVYTLFDWELMKMEVKTSIYDEHEGYAVRKKVFKISDGSLESDKLFNFIYEAKGIVQGMYNITPDEVIGVVKQLKTLSKPFESEEAAKNHFFNQMADLMLLMRQKKLRNNHKLLKTYMGLVYYLWSKFGDDFLKFLEISEEEFMGEESTSEEKTSE